MPINMGDINHESILRQGLYNGLSITDMPEQLVMRLYRFMVRLRKCQEAIAKEYHPADEMRCPIHFAIGQEAVPAALSLLLTDEDFLFSHHRSHGYYLAKGASMSALIAELYGRETGANGGLAGSQEVSAPHLNFYSGAIISGMIGTAVGAGFGIMSQGGKNIAVAGFGDAATEEGLFWEAISYASLRNIPVLFICENNGYSTYSPQKMRQPADIHHRVASFGIKTHALFGNDVVGNYKTMKDAVSSIREGSGPVFIEAYTYRFMGHVGPEDDDYVGYRPKEEIDFWRSNCPIRLLEAEMEVKGLLDEEKKGTILREIETEIAASFNFARNSAFPEATDWTNLNYRQDTPVADQLLQEGHTQHSFDGQQRDDTPGPY